MTRSLDLLMRLMLALLLTPLLIAVVTYTTLRLLAIHLADRK